MPSAKRFIFGTLMTAASLLLIVFVVNRLPYPGVKNAFQIR